MEQILTEGARRTLRLAAHIARQAAAAQIEALHLLWALILEESHATEILQQYGVSPEELGDLWPLEVSFDQFEMPAADEQLEHLPQSEPFQSVVLEARRLVGLAGRHAALGSEHLLYGLATVDSPARDALKRYGLRQDTLSGLVSEKSGFSSEPIAVDEHISWAVQPESVRTDTFRILDAGANRAREGLRVLEDYVRFALDDAYLTRLLKNARHELSAALRPLDTAGMLAARDTNRDVGTSITTESEALRADALDVVKASFKRVQEAVRSLEEFAKVVSTSPDVSFGKLRYDLYTLEKAVLLTAANRHRLEGRNLYLLVSEELCHHGSGPAVREALAAGVRIVQVREKSMPDGKLVEQARRLRRWAEEAGALLIVNDRPDIAVLVDADGVHVGQHELSVREARRVLGPNRLVGVSTHTLEQARRAVLDGADYIGVGPVYSSKTKDFEQIAGLELVREVAAEIKLPWFAIGGIDVNNIAVVLDSGATRVAVSSAICSAEHPGQAAGQLLAALRARPGSDDD